MVGKTRLFSLVTALALGLLFLAPATNAYAWDHGPRAVFHGHFGLPHATVGVYANDGRYFYQRRYRSYYRHDYYRHFYYRPLYFPQHFYRPYYLSHRIVRPYVYGPFPHWAVRRFYSPHRYPY